MVLGPVCDGSSGGTALDNQGQCFPPAVVLNRSAKLTQLLFYAHKKNLWRRLKTMFREEKCEMKVGELFVFRFCLFLSALTTLLWCFLR